jgi:hypothetical protein
MPVRTGASLPYRDAVRTKGIRGGLTICAMDEMEALLPESDLGPVRHRPVGLIVLLVLMTLAAAAVGAYARWLTQQRALTESQLAQTERKVLDLREQLTRSEIALQEKQAALATREIALAEAMQPELPVRVSFRPAWMGQGMVATLRNEATRPLSLMVEVVDSRAHRSKSFALDINPGNSAEIGHAQGWLVTSGQSVKVAATGYRSIMAFPP